MPTVRAYSPQTTDEVLQSLLQEAALFLLLARGFSYPEPGHPRRVEEQFRQVRAAWDGHGRAQPVPRLLTAAQRAWNAADLPSLQAEYSRLFVGNAPCGLHETAYGDGRRIAGRAVELADISGFYAAFGFAPAHANPDLPDHLCAELEFYSLLLVKQAYALSENRADRARIARQAAATFLEQHLGRWSGALAQTLVDHRAAAPYLNLAVLMEATVNEQCRKQHITPPPVTGRLPADAMQGESFRCSHEA